MTFEHDGEAEDFLISKGWVFDKGLGKHPDKNHVDTQEERDAMNYLFHEWDYCFE